jgi:hypothetical protein
MGENECGMYALFFIITMLIGYVEINKVTTIGNEPFVISSNDSISSDGSISSNKRNCKRFSNYIEKINFFKDKRIPDTYVKQFRKIYFNPKHK